jgi:hypothetical protein
VGAVIRKDNNLNKIQCTVSLVEVNTIEKYKESREFWENL